MSEEGLLRLCLAVLIFSVLSCLEIWRPRRNLSAAKTRRWPGNLAVAGLNLFVVRFLLPWLVPVLVAQQVLAMQLGVLNQLSLPFWLEVGLALLLLDVVIYWQHRLFHRVPLLWRLHRMHHTENEIDVSTALRFHPFEIALSLMIKSIVIILSGAPVVAVLLFEVLLNGMALFNHANFRLSERWDARLRRVIVTPDMHRVHHSVLSNEHNANFGFNLSCWDRWFDSYRAQPHEGHHKMLLGLYETNGQPTGSLVWMLRQPFKTVERK